MNSAPRDPIHPAKVQTLCNRLSIAVLVTGFICAGWIWATQGSRPDENEIKIRGTLSPDDSAKYQRQVEIYSGRVGVLVEKWTREAAALSYGKPLAVTVAVGSIVVAGACFLAGVVLSQPLAAHPARSWEERGDKIDD